MSAIQIDLPKTMRSVMCYGPRDYRFEEIAVPKAKPGEVLVRILDAGICAGDAKCHSGAPLFWGDEYREGYCQPPVTPGHEFVGEVVALGEGAAEKYEQALGLSRQYGSPQQVAIKDNHIARVRGKMQT